MPPMTEETGQRLVTLLEEILAGQSELLELLRPSFAGHWGNTTIGFGAVGVLGVLVALAQFFGRPTPVEVLRFPRDVGNTIGQGVEIFAVRSRRLAVGAGRSGGSGSRTRSLG